MILSKETSKKCVKPPLPISSLRNLEDIMGERVKAIIPDISTAPASEKANSVNSAPVNPPIKPIGRKTATSVMDMAITGMPSSLAPIRAASIGFLPSSICLLTFSTTMIASSTTSPIARTMARRVSKFIE